MAKKSSGIWSLVLVPAIVSLVVTILRLVGELNHWDAELFSNVAPGEKPGGQFKLGYIGLAWLIPIFGFWFGFKLRRATGEPPHIGKAALRFLIGAGILVGGLWLLVQVGLVSFPSAEAPGQPRGIGYSIALVLIAALVGFTAWPLLGRALVLYGLLARLPVVVVTWLALEKGWDCHYTKMPVGSELPQGVDPFMPLAVPQLTVWVAATLILGGLMGCVGAAVGGRGAKA